MRLILVLTFLFILGLYFLGPILLIPVAIYLAVGLAIFFIGTWVSPGGNRSIIRRCEKKLALKDETIRLNLFASASQMPAIVEAGVPWNIVLVIDKSASMMGTPLGIAKVAARNLVSTTPRDFQYGIVEFQQYAHTRCQLTSNEEKLKNTISKIVSSGGTAIHEGLRMAAQVLKDEIQPGKKNAVILFSNGASDHEPAQLQADQLKEQGVVIYSIGLGCCDEELMEKIASDSEKYFYIRNPKDLKMLYHSIGRIVQNAPGKEVEITEFPNTQKAPFNIMQWGDIQPSSIHLTGTNKDTASSGKGNPLSISVQWYLPSLEKGNICLDYYLRSRCYGWYRAADGKAQLALKDQQGNLHNFSSNKGPYVLIIPRFFLWQIAWIFLNPLFWMVFQKLRCKPGEMLELQEYEPPTRVPISQPDILPTLEVGFKLSASPTLAIGVGHGGIHALTHLKRLLWEHNEDEEIEKKVIFAAVDTVKPWLSDTVKIGHISLDLDKKLNIHAPVSDFIKQEAEKHEPGQDYTWLHAKQKRAEGIDYDIGFGTNLDRGIARLMYLQQREPLHENADAANIRTMLLELHEKNKGEKIQVCIAGTLNGGTSSGVILDLCYSLKKTLEELDIVGAGITLFLMDYQVETNDPQRETKNPVVRANKQAFINELARFFAARAQEFSPLPGDKAINRWFDRIIWVDKKNNTTNLADLYPQCGILMYYWAVEKYFRDLLLDNTEYIHTGLRVHKFEIDAVFFFKRTLEHYYSVRLLLTTLGNLVLGLPENPKDYSVKSASVEKEYIEAAFELLVKNPGWTNAMPAMLKNKDLFLNPKANYLSLFINQGGMAGIVENSSQDQVNKYLDVEDEAFTNLLFAWIESMLGTYKTKQDQSTTAFRAKKLPTAYLSLQCLKENFEKIRLLAEKVPDSAEYLVKKKCMTVVEMCTRFTGIIDQWCKKLGQWWDILGEGTEKITGTCRVLNALLNDLEKSIDTTQSYTTPHFVFDANVNDKIYQKYFAQLEPIILEQLHWQVDEASQKVRFLIVDDKEVKKFDADLKNARISEDMFKVILTLPAYFASEKNQWHVASIHDMIDLTRQAGQDIVEDYLVPQVMANTLPNLLYLSPQITGVLDQRISAGMERQTVESKNPIITGFFKYKLNHEEVSTKTKFHPQALPAYVFSEEWNCYHALKIYSNLVDEEPLTPSYTLIVLCRNMKKFLGAIHQGIIDNQVESCQSGGRMVYRLFSTEAPQTEDSDAGIINLLRVIVESKDLAVEKALGIGYSAILKMNLKSIRDSLTKSPLPLLDNVREQFIQVTAGAVEYYKNLE